MVKLSFVIFEKLFLASAALNNRTDHRPRDVEECNCVMTHIEKPADQVGNLYGLRNWVEYGLQSKNELGWADFRVTNYAQIERWWEMVMSAYLLVSLHTNALHQPQPQPPIQRDAQPQAIVLKLHNIRVGIRQTETGAQQFAFRVI